MLSRQKLTNAVISSLALIGVDTSLSADALSRVLCRCSSVVDGA
jgi:hypothetical protein